MKPPRLWEVAMFQFAWLLAGCAGSSKTTHICPDGEVVTVLEDIEEAYPTYAKTYDISVSAGVDAIDSVLANAKLDVGVKTEVKALRESLDQERISIQEQLKTAVLGLQTTPCDKEIRKKFFDLLAKINDNATKASMIAKDPVGATKGM